MRWPFVVFRRSLHFGRDDKTRNPGHRAHGVADKSLPGGEIVVLLHCDF